MEEQLRAEAIQCTLQVSLARPDPSVVMLTYVFENGSPQNAFLFNQIYRQVLPDGMFATEPQRVYIEASGDGVLLSKKIIPVPDTMDVEKPFIPCATMVKPGESFQETLALPLPLRPWHHYLMLTDDDFASEPTELPASFELGFFLATPEGEKLAQTVRTMTGQAAYFYPFNPASQTLLRVGPFRTRLPVRLPK